MTRRKTKSVRVGDLQIGGLAPVVVQSMNATDTRDSQATLAEIYRLADRGCELTRVAVPDNEAADSLRQICLKSPLPVVADIHFDPRLALASLRAGAHKLRINPGNWPAGEGWLEKVAGLARERGVPIRVGVNAGSLSREITGRYGGVTAEALAVSALESARQLENLGFYDLVLSVKASDLPLTIAANRLLAARSEHPLHIGITEAGLPKEGILRSAVGLGVLLEEGIGDTLRVSLTAPPEQEVDAAFSILRSLGLRDRGALLISCPTCGRTEVNLLGLAEAVQERLQTISRPIRVAVMGCAVNGPGEARHADVGLAGGREEYLIFRRGQVVAKVPEEEALPRLMAEIDALLREP